MNVSGGNSKEILELFTNKLFFSVSVAKTKMMILSRCAFREKCIFMDYDYNERDFVFNFCEVLLFKTRRQKAHHCFVYFIKAQRFVDIVSAHK